MATVIHRSIGVRNAAEVQDVEWMRAEITRLRANGYVVHRYAVQDRDGRPLTVFGVGRSALYLTNVIEVTF